MNESTHNIETQITDLPFLNEDLVNEDMMSSMSFKRVFIVCQKHIHRGNVIILYTISKSGITEKDWKDCINHWNNTEFIISRKIIEKFPNSSELEDGEIGITPEILEKINSVMQEVKPKL